MNVKGYEKQHCKQTSAIGKEVSVWYKINSDISVLLYAEFMLERIESKAIAADLPWLLNLKIVTLHFSYETGEILIPINTTNIPAYVATAARTSWPLRSRPLC